MSTFSEKLAAAKAAPRPVSDLQILLAGDIVAERDRLQVIIDTPVTDARLAAASPQEQAKIDLEKLYERAGDALITLRFIQLPGTAWAAITSKCPPRPGVPVDEQYGYNFDTATMAAARFIDEDGRHYGVRIEDDVEVPFTVERTKDNPNGVDEWSDLIETLTGHDLRKLRNTVWGLNEYLPQIQLEAMGKAFGATGNSAKG